MTSDPKQRIIPIEIAGVPCFLYRVIRPDNTLGGWSVSTAAGTVLVRYAMTMKKYAVAEAQERLAAIASIPSKGLRRGESWQVQGYPAVVAA